MKPLQQAAFILTYLVSTCSFRTSTMAHHVFQKSNPILGRGNYHAKLDASGKQQKFKLIEGMMIDSSLPQQPSMLSTRGDKKDLMRFSTTASDIGQLTMKEESKFAPANVNKVV